MYITEKRLEKQKKHDEKIKCDHSWIAGVLEWEKLFQLNFSIYRLSNLNICLNWRRKKTISLQKARIRYTHVVQQTKQAK